MVGYKITKEDKKRLKQLKKELKGNISDIAKKFCIEKDLKYTDSSRKRISYFFNPSKGKKEVLTPQEEVEYKAAQDRVLNKSKVYLFTWEQNRTPIHPKLWKNILAYKDFHNAELSVILGRYRNPTSVFIDKKNESWNDETIPYRDANRHDIHKYLTVLSDVKIQPTAINPLVGLEGITGETTTIVGHPKMHLKPVPVLEGHPKKILLTTGAITVPNYVDSKAGKRGEFTHTLGFTIVEIKDDETFYIRQVEADEDGNFIDLYYEVSDGVVSDLDRAEAIVWGDTHIESMSPEVLKTTENLIERLNIKTEVHHDLTDGTAVNNHIVKDPFQQFKRWKENGELVEVNIRRAIQFLKKRPENLKIVVQANHNDRFDRWLVNHDWKTDIPNAKTYLKYALAKLEGKAEKGILAYLLEEEFNPNEVLCLDYDDSYFLNNHEVAHHGHIGSNGSRGSIEQFRRMSTNIILGHYHKPMRFDRVITVGTSTELREGYNKGASDWLQAHILIHKNNTTQHVIIIKGGYTTFN